jgi:hypothetical protein
MLRAKCRLSSVARALSVASRRRANSAGHRPPVRVRACVVLHACIASLCAWRSGGCMPLVAASACEQPRTGMMRTRIPLMIWYSAGFSAT